MILKKKYAVVNSQYRQKYLTVHSSRQYSLLSSIMDVIEKIYNNSVWCNNVLQGLKFSITFCMSLVLGLFNYVGNIS